MKTKFVLASLVAALSGLAALVPSANAAPDIQLRVNLALPPPPVVLVSDRGHGHSRDGHRHHRHDRGNSRNQGTYGRDWYDQQREVRQARNGHSEARGYWKEVVVETWVPARWDIRQDRWGREVRTYRPGYMSRRVNRVWVSGGR